MSDPGFVPAYDRRAPQEPRWKDGTDGDADFGDWSTDDDLPQAEFSLHALMAFWGMDDPEDVPEFVRQEPELWSLRDGSWYYEGEDREFDDEDDELDEEIMDSVCTEPGNDTPFEGAQPIGVG